MCMKDLQESYTYVNNSLSLQTHTHIFLKMYVYCSKLREKNPCMQGQYLKYVVNAYDY